MSYVSVAVMASLWAVFATSTWGKVRSRTVWEAFVDSLRPLLRTRPTRPVGIALAVAEGGVVLGLTWSLAAVVAAWPGARVSALVTLSVAVVLLGVLTAGVVLAVRKRTGALCACFGVAARPLSRRHVVRNALLSAMAAGALPAAAAGQGVDPAGATIAVVGGLVAAAIIISLDDLVELFKPATSLSGARPHRDDRRRR